MITELSVTTIAHAIQLAVALVFLLSNRLARIIDRSRFLHSGSLPAVKTNQAIQVELTSLRRRARLIHWAIGLCTACLLLICSVVAVLFLGSFFTLNMAVFVAAMLCLIMALLNFIGEIYLATAHVRGGP